jgi:type VI secretion system FHA domain protein
MDWTLPDADRHISSHHFDVEYRDGGYFLIDKSTNGLFLQGQRHRLDGAHRLRSGDRFQVGHYFVVATVTDGGGAATAAAPAIQQPPAPRHEEAADPWSIGGPPVAPINPNPPSDPRIFEDFSGEFIINPSPPPMAPVPGPMAAPSPAASASPFGNSPGGGASGGFSPTPAPQPAQAAVPQYAPAASAGGGSNDAIIAAFCAGAGLSPNAYAGANAEALAHELGRTMRVAAQELMALLQDRASTKKFTKGGERTMMGATDNNPLKFLPDAAQALEVMYLRPRDGFMKGGEGMIAAFGDVRMHQMAVFAAIQPALIKLLSDLAPEAIEDNSTGSLLGGGGKRKSWDTYVERWDAKVGKHENGMLDVFLAHFAEAYAAAVKAARR